MLMCAVCVCWQTHVCQLQDRNHIYVVCVCALYVFQHVCVCRGHARVCIHIHT